MNSSPRVLYRKDVKIAQEYMTRYKITALPIITTKGCVNDVIFLQQEMTETEEAIRGLENVPVVIMDGEKGIRLYPYTKILPKPLIPIGDVPIMERKAQFKIIGQLHSTF